MSDIKESIRKLERAILEDGKVDRAEAQILLAFAQSRTADNAEMAEFKRVSVIKTRDTEFPKTTTLKIIRNYK